MLDAVRAVLEDDARVAYALVFGSAAREALRVGSDLDLAIATGTALSARDLGALVSRLEAAAGRQVDVVLLDEAPVALAFRVFRDGRVLVVRDRSAFVERKARAIVEYLDFRPIEERCTRGVLAAASRG
jgi:hypothetical protein